MAVVKNKCGRSACSLTRCVPREVRFDLGYGVHAQTVAVLRNDAARRLVGQLQLDTLVSASLVRSHSRLTDLIAGHRPEPGYPDLE